MTRQEIQITIAHLNAAIKGLQTASYKNARLKMCGQVEIMALLAAIEHLKGLLK